jgi:hypothetical protein
MGETAVSEAKLAGETTSILETVEKINEALRDTRISELCAKLKAYARALDALVNKKHHWFDLQFVVNVYQYAGSDYRVNISVNGELISSITVGRNATVDTVFERIFTSQEVKSEVVDKIYKTLAELVSEIASKANLVERIKEIEKRLEEEDP